MISYDMKIENHYALNYFFPTPDWKSFNFTTSNIWYIRDEFKFFIKK